MDSKDSGPNEEPAQQPTSQEDFTAEEPKNTVSELEKQDDKETKTQNNDQQHLDTECERLLRAAKKQVKQMMEEAVTKKFIHEESGSIISLCVAVDACLLHGLKRRSLGLFKTNSSTALIQKIAKCCPPAQEVLQLVEDEEKRQQMEQASQVKHNSTNSNKDNNDQFQLRQQQQQYQATPRQGAQPNSLTRQRLHVCTNVATGSSKQHTSLRSPSIKELQKRYLWLKYALIEKKLVEIVEYLAKNASKYYQTDALMADCLSAQLLCSLLVGPCALEYSRSKTNDYYQFDEPSAEELLNRHKLSNPIACLCSSKSAINKLDLPARNNNDHHSRSYEPSDSTYRRNARLARWTSSENQKDVVSNESLTKNSTWTQQEEMHQIQQQQQQLDKQTSQHRRMITRSLSTTGCGARGSSEDQSGSHRPPVRSARTGYRVVYPTKSYPPPADHQSSDDLSLAPSRRSTSLLDRNRQILAGGQKSRRRPLALKSTLTGGNLITDCNHCSCKEITEHQHTKGYSFRCKSSSTSANGSACFITAPLNASVNQSFSRNGSSFFSMNGQSIGTFVRQQQMRAIFSGKSKEACLKQDESLALWSPRMLHETLHQNSRSNLLYAKNNVLVETQSHGLMAGYLSLHQTNSDLIIKWIPNQLINGGQQVNSHLAKQSKTIAADGHLFEEGSSDETRDNLDSRSRSLDDFSARAEKRGGSRAYQMVVGSSYLDLVVNLSVTRIVLMHCHFVPRSNQKPLRSGSNIEHHSEPEERERAVEDPQFRSRAQTSPGEQIKRLRRQHLTSHLMETLILVEVDGVQRAPFKFPKGGLRWFLSCLENGLHPDYYLELAIKPENGPDWPWVEDEEQTSQHESSLEDSASSISKAGESSATGPLDLLLRRLPSLKRNQAQKEETSSQDLEKDNPSEADKNMDKGENVDNAEQSTAYPDEAASLSSYRPMREEDSVSENVSPKTTLGTLNYVYRIISIQQQEWALPTPPHSALNITSSSSGSNGPTASVNGLGSRWARFTGVQAQSQPEDNLVCGNLNRHSSEGSNSFNPASRFRWSLSRLTRFSRSSAGSSSSPVGPLSASLATSVTVTSEQKVPGSNRLNNSNILSKDLSMPTTDSLELDDENSAWKQEFGDRRDSSSSLFRIDSKLEHLRERSSSREELLALRDQSVQTLCNSMRRQILARAFYGWLAHCRRTKIIRTHLLKLIKFSSEETNHLIDPLLDPDRFYLACLGLTESKWNELMGLARVNKISGPELCVEVSQLVYYGGVASDKLRCTVWPYLLGHYDYIDQEKARKLKDGQLRETYDRHAREWGKIEKIIKQRDNEILAANMARVERKKRQQLLEENNKSPRRVSETVGPATDENDELSLKGTGNTQTVFTRRRGSSIGGEWQENGVDFAETETAAEDDLIMEESSSHNQAEEEEHWKEEKQNGEEGSQGTEAGQKQEAKDKQRLKRQQQARKQRKRKPRLDSTGSVGSDASITDQFGNNIHRIDKDVQRCDRQFWYFQKQGSLDKLRNIMCSYVWQNLDVGYVQGMCDLAAPFLVIFDDEFKAFCCFNQLMKRMVSNFPHGNAMDQHFESLKYLIQILDPKLYEVLQRNGDYNHFYFCYRWLLLDFKRELAYEDVYRVWETIWAAQRIASDHFVVFLALSMVRYYRDIIIENNMDFTDTIKFFNEMAERHDARKIIELAQNSLLELVNLIKS